MKSERRSLKNPKELAELLDMSVSSIHRLVREGRIPAVDISPKTRRFDLSEVMEALGRRQRDDDASK